jgi:hypothetical protein
MKAFQIANSIIREEAMRDWEECEGKRRKQAGTSALSVGRTRSYFSQDALPILDRVSKFKLPTTDQALTNLRSALADTSHLPIWNAAIYSLLEYKGEFYEQWYDTLSWKIGRQRAFDVLTQRDIAAELFGNVQDELRLHSSETFKGIIANIRMLERFKAVHDGPTTISEEKHIYSLYPLDIRNENKAVVKTYVSVQQNVSFLI